MPKSGIKNGQLMPCPSSPNCVSSQAEDNAHFIEPIKASGSLAQVKKTLMNVLLHSVRATVTQTEGNYIRAEFFSLIFRFVDDVEFLIVEQGPDEILVHVRSASRVGYSDFGVNRKRIEKIRSRFSELNE
ncbi:MAG: DUF1499 domain-containing protein [Neptuniibacter sp.]